MDRASVLELRERDSSSSPPAKPPRRRVMGVLGGGGEGAGQQEQEQEPDVSTPVSYFDPYDEAEASGTAAAATALGAAGDGESPRVQIDMKATVVHFDEDAALSPSADAAAAGAASGDDPLALPSTPRDGPKNRFVVSFEDVVSPEKAENFVPKPPQAGRKRRELPSPARRVEEEGLGDDWATRPWKEPSVDVARTARRRALVRQGRLPLWSTDPDDLLFLSAGITLYFYLVRALACFFFVASLLHVPHLIIAWSGGMLEAYQVSDWTAGAFMAASHMIAYPGEDRDKTRWCEQEAVDTIFAPRVPCTEPVIRLFSRRSQVYIKADHASVIITTCDALTCLLFVATWWLLLRKHRALKRATPMTSVVRSKDYAIAVRGLPRDATEQEIVQHFNRLYAINGGDEDWTHPGDCCGLVNAKTYQRDATSILDLTGKVIGPTLQPVDEPLPAHDHPVYKRSWVVEAAVVHPMGILIRRFKKLETLSKELLYQRAVAKKYNPANTTFKGGKGGDARKFEKAMTKLRATQDRIDDEQLRLKALAGDLIKMEKLCAGAYVVFEHRRSRDRALRDYELYSNHLLPFVKPPPPLLFRGKHRLRVTEAPAPRDIIYENWEVPFLSRLGRRVITNLVTIGLLCVVLVVVVLLRAASNDAAGGAQFDAGLCEVLGEQVYQDAVPVLFGQDPWFHFPPESPEAASLCAPGSHYLSYYPPGQINLAHANQGGCLDPCFDPHDQGALHLTEVCPSGRQVQREAILKCYCMSQARRVATAATSTSAVADWSAASYEQMAATGVVDLCRAPAYRYFKSQLVNALASIVTNVVNEAIRFALPILVGWEKRSCLSESVTAFFVKSLLFLFLNTAGLLLLTHVHIENAFLNRFGFFNGNGADFDLSWYLMVGLALSNTMVVNAFTMQLPFLTSELLVNPLWQRLRSTVANRVSQIHLTKAYAPSAFQVPTRLAMLINTLIITLLFNSALPLLFPLAFVAFASAYLTDKFLLLRFSANPPAYDGRLVRLSIDMMPYLLFGHLLVAICVFGHPDFFQSGVWLRLEQIKVKEHGTTKTAYEVLAESKTNADIVSRVFLYSTLPLCLLLVVLVVGKLLAFLWQDVMGVGRFVRKAVSPYTQRCCARLDAEGWVPHEQQDDDVDEERGWRRQERGRDRKSKTAAAWRRQQRNRVNNYPPYTRKFEILYPSRSELPDVPPGQGWEVELTAGIRTSKRMNVVKLVKRWMGDELSSPQHKDRSALAVAAAAAADAEEGEEHFHYKKTWEVVREGGGLHTYAIEANPDYAEVMLVRATLHLSAKSLLGIETSRMDWSRAYESVRKIQRGWGVDDHGDDSSSSDDDDDDDDDDDEEEEEEAAGGHRRVGRARGRSQKVNKGRRADGSTQQFSSLMLLGNRAAAEEEEKRTGKGGIKGAVADSA